MALADRPGFVRAELGLAQLVYQRSFRGCQHPDARGLDESQRRHESVLSDGSASPMTRARAHFGLGQIHTCRSQALLGNEWQQARAALAKVIQMYKANGDLLLRELASESYALMAFADSPAIDGGPQIEKTMRAIGEFECAIELAQDNSRAELFRRFKANLEKRLSQIQGLLGSRESTSTLRPSTTVRCL
jgi:hypothetical protein